MTSSGGTRTSMMVDNKPRILAATKQFWGERVTTVFVRQGSYAHDANAVATSPPADVTIEHIEDLIDCDVTDWVRHPASLPNA